MQHPWISLGRLDLLRAQYTRCEQPTQPQELHCLEGLCLSSDLYMNMCSKGTHTTSGIQINSLLFLCWDICQSCCCVTLRLQRARYDSSNQGSNFFQTRMLLHFIIRVTRVHSWLLKQLFVEREEIHSIRSANSCHARHASKWCDKNIFHTYSFGWFVVQHPNLTRWNHCHFRVGVVRITEKKVRACGPSLSETVK